MNVFLLPVKSLVDAKERLGDRPAARASVAKALVEDSFDLAAASSMSPWCVLTSDTWARELASSRGLDVLADVGPDLNSCLGAAAQELEGRGATSMTVIPVDLPLAEPDDLEQIVDTGATSDVVIVPAHGSGGTNALYLSPPTVMPTSFGEGSLTAHIDEASRRRLRWSALALPNLALDLDTWEDAASLLRVGNRPARRVFKILDRLPALP